MSFQGLSSLEGSKCGGQSWLPFGQDREGLQVLGLLRKIIPSNVKLGIGPK